MRTAIGWTFHVKRHWFGNGVDSYWIVAEKKVTAITSAKTTKLTKRTRKRGRNIRSKRCKKLVHRSDNDVAGGIQWMVYRTSNRFYITDPASKRPPRCSQMFPCYHYLRFSRRQHYLSLNLDQTKPSGTDEYCRRQLHLLFPQQCCVKSSLQTTTYHLFGRS